MSTETSVTTYAPGTFSWVDLNTLDTAAAANFYGTLFGWTHRQVGDPHMPYTMFFKDGKEVCGMMGFTDDMKAHKAHPHWLSYVSVENADATVQHAEKLGGKVMMPPMDAMDAGRMAIVVDRPALCSASGSRRSIKAPKLVNQVGSFCWNELLTSDTARASSFYTQLFPWKANTNDNFGMTYTMFDSNGQGRSGMMEFTKAPPNWMVDFVVENYDKSEARAVELGAKVMMPPMDVPNLGKFAVLVDPQKRHLLHHAHGCKRLTTRARPGS